MDTRRTAAIWATVVAGVVMLTGYGLYQIGEAEGSKMCYKNLYASGTWSEVRPLVDAAIKDNFLTKRECGAIDDAYADAKTRQDRIAYIREYKKT